VLIVKDEDALVALGRSLAGACDRGLVIYLRGELGAGKTTLTRGVARGLGHEAAVKSPTYTLVEPYADLDLPLYHFDLYRLGNPEELEFMGIRDYFNADALVVVEWPERGAGFLPPSDLEITIAVADVGREVSLVPGSEAGAQCVQKLGGP